MCSCHTEGVELYLSAADSVVELIPAIVLDLDGDDIPAFPWSEGSEWTPEAHADWIVRRREALGLQLDRPVDGLIALDEVVSDRLLDAVADYVCDCAQEYGWSPYLDGGLVLAVDGRVFSRPTCCVDLKEGVADWVRLSEEWPATWTGVESGHPGVLARWQGDRIQVSEQADDFPDRILPSIELGIDQLRAALPRALVEISLFASRLEPRLAAREVDEPKSRALIVAGLADESQNRSERPPARVSSRDPSTR